jgi:hypothetical protein
VRNTNTPQSGEWLSEQVTGNTTRFSPLFSISRFSIHYIHFDSFTLSYSRVSSVFVETYNLLIPFCSNLTSSIAQLLLSPKVPSYQDVVVCTNGEQARGPVRCTSDRNRQQRKARLFPRRVGAALRTAHQCRGLMKKNLGMGDCIDTRQLARNP